MGFSGNICRHWSLEKIKFPRNPHLADFSKIFKKMGKFSEQELFATNSYSENFGSSFSRSKIFGH